MKRHYTLIIGSLMLLAQVGFGQVYLDEFDGTDAGFLGGSPTYSFDESNGEITVQASNTGMWDVFTYELNDGTASVDADATGNNKVFVRAKASNVGTQLRMDIQDADGFVTSLAGITKTLTTDYMVLEYDFTGLYQDGGFGGTPCTSGPCAVDGAQTSTLVFFTDPGVGGFNGTVVIDYISFGEEPAGVIMSDVYQDHFEMDSSINNFTFLGAGYSASIDTDNSEITISGDGTTPMWDPCTYVLRNPNTLDPIDVDMTGNNKFYIKMKSSQPNTAVRVDMQDIDGFVTTQGSITKIVGTDYAVYEFDYGGAYADLGFGGTPCTMSTAPCPVDGERISNFIMFIEPGVGGFLGEITIDYLSFDIPLEPGGPPADLIYGDHFNNEVTDFVGDTPGIISTETGTEWTMTGDGTSGAFAAVSYLLNDVTEQVSVNMAPAQNKVFVKAKVDEGTVPLRLDILDTAGYVTSQTSLTKIIGDEYEVYEFDFTGGFFDGGFGGSPCMAGPCPVDPTVITQILLYPDPVAGVFDGEVTIDFISIGQPLDDDPGSPVGILNYSDQMDDNTINFLGDDPAGLVTTIADDEMTITGDGTGGMWTPVTYETHNDLGELILANAVGSSDKLFVRAKSSVGGTELRIDLADFEGFVTNNNAQSVNLTEDYEIYELTYTGAYADGGFGGTPCDVGPCPVDGERIAQLQFFANPGVGMLNGTITIDWVSFGQPLGGGGGPTGVINYLDEIDENTVLFIEDMPGLVSSTSDIWTVTGDGTGDMWTPVVYSIHNDLGETIIADAVGSNDKLFIRAKSSSDVELRIDLQDNQDYVTNFSAQSMNLTADTEFAVFEYNYAGAYQDGGFGGTPCDAGPCPVDGQRISAIHFFFNPGVGEYNGTFELDWLAFGEPLPTAVTDLERLNSLSAYPNPILNELYLEYDLAKNAEVELNVMNMLGSQVMYQKVGLQSAGAQQAKLNFGSLMPGVYVIQILANGSSAGTLRLVKQ